MEKENLEAQLLSSSDTNATKQTNPTPKHENKTENNPNFEMNYHLNDLTVRRRNSMDNYTYQFNYEHIFDLAANYCIDEENI